MVFVHKAYLCKCGTRILWYISTAASSVVSLVVNVVGEPVVPTEQYSGPQLPMSSYQQQLFSDYSGQPASCVSNL